jgi:1-acyl-sn-glycerol-3-phosphate acyltransferase
VRALLWRLLWTPIFCIWSPGFRAAGTVPRSPVVFAANHSSHADTAAIQLALSKAGHTRVLAAGAEDYFFRNVLIAACARLIGVFPFPRSGRLGIERARSILGRGTSVLLFPQGTRNGGPFRRGVAHLADAAPVVPVTVTGTDRLLPKGTGIPKRSLVTVRFGSPIRRIPGETAEQFVRRLEQAVRPPAPIKTAA